MVRSLNKNFAEIAIALPINKTFDYSMPEHLQENVDIGMRARVPFGYKSKVGYILGLKDKSSIKNIRPIDSLIDDKPLLNGDNIKLAKWMSDYYLCSWGEAIEAILPTSIKDTVRPDDGEMPLSSQQALKMHLKASQQQKKALDEIIASIGKGRHSVHLLHGITASGKTEVYIQCIDYALSKGYSSIVLVAEIALTTQTIERLKERFGDLLAVWHSRLTRAQRLKEWHKVKSQKAKIVVGARSAVFAPVDNLGLIVIDEEHETTYKQETQPRYHARDVAIARVKMSNAVLILSSATPSVESYYNALNGTYNLIELTERITKQDLPSVDIVDMRRQFSKKKPRIFSHLLEKSIAQTLAKKEQLILFLNRRGFSTYINCPKCGEVIKCKNCSTALTYHFNIKKLICHWCNFKMDPPKMCPKCNEFYVRYSGTGTEKVENELQRLFPGCRIGRLDSDVTKKRLAHDLVLNDFKEHKLDVLVGTQMIAKGLDFPKVTLVGVISADTALSLVDFRASERAFNLLTQVAGRSGRGSEEGKVIVQTYTPGHYAIMAAKTHDYAQFYKNEIIQRQQMKLPPFAHIILLTFNFRKSDTAKDVAEKFVKYLSRHKKNLNTEVAGPVTAPIPKIKKNYRWNISLKTKDVIATNKFLRKALEDFKGWHGVKVTVDVDPVNIQ